MMNCMEHSMLTLRETCNIVRKCIDLLHHVGPGPHTLVLHEGGVTSESSLQLAWMDWLKMPLQWRGVRMQLKSEIVDTAQ